MPRLTHVAALLILVCVAARQARAQESGPRIFISVDMEGVGGVGSPAMTDEVNAVVEAILARGPARILLNDSHGDHQNVLHTELDPRVVFIQGAIKPLGMVQGLDGSFDGVIFLGYHAMAGDPDGFLAHTGTGSVT